MSDKYHSLTVVLKNDMNDEDAAGLMKAILYLKGVENVSGNVVNVSDYIAQSRAQMELGQKIIEVIYPHIKKDGA